MAMPNQGARGTFYIVAAKDDIKDANFDHTYEMKQPTGPKAKGQWRGRQKWNDPPNVNQPDRYPSTDYYGKEGEKHPELGYIGDPTEDAAAGFKSLSTDMANALTGGRADKKRPSEFDDLQLKDGISHEMEHTNSKKIAREIAMDHLAEDPDYYKKLGKMEPAAIEKALPEGYSLKHERIDTGKSYKEHQVTAHHGGKEVGRMVVKNAGRKLVATGVDVHEDHRRKGVASAMYTHAEEKTGKKFRRSKDQTTSGKELWKQSNREFGKAIGTKDRSDEDDAKKTKVGKAGKKTVDAKGKKRYNYDSGSAARHKNRPANGSDPPSDIPGGSEIEPVHPGHAMAEQLAHITRVHPDEVKRLARKFEDSDQFKRHFMARFGQLAQKHGIQSQHLYQIHDASVRKSDIPHIIEIDKPGTQYVLDEPVLKKRMADES